MGPSNRKKETQRDIIANNQQYNNRFNYANNFIKTSKYTLLTFLPLNLLEQFQRAANFYFACLLILQLIPEISSLTPITTALPLFGVLSLTAIKYAYDDVQRHRTDRTVNNRKSQVLRKGYLVEEKWHRVQVGDVIRMENNSFIAADILLLSSYNPNGLCYIETAELDGETNLKVKQCLEATNVLGEDEKSLSHFNGHIICEPPNNNLSKFEGTLSYNSQKYSLDNEKVLLRGAVLRNTPWCYGVVLFAGKDTKLMQNSGKTKFKRTSIDKLLNFIILGIVIFLLCMCLFCTVACGIWESLIGYSFQIFHPWDTVVPAERVAGATVISLLVFFSYAIVLNTVVPISLYVSVEVIRLFLSMLIDWDREMYDAKSNTPAKARTTTLNEELGQIQYIFSDKTGTLTQNIMTFNKCSINQVSYGDIIDENTGEPMELDEHSKRVDFSSNDFSEPTFEFYDQKLFNEVEAGNKEAQEFFRLLALCHTVMPDYSEDGVLEYQAQSPDENALVSAARNFGFIFTERTSRTITIRAQGKLETYELLCILDFNNVRKRMSVIVKHEGRIRLYCKGADNVIFERLGPGQADMRGRTQDHLDRFASDGLRTLCLGVKDLTQEQFDNWKAEHHKAAVALEEREEKLDAVYNVIEKDLTLIGATAIEDKLQDGVAQTIANLQLAGIKLWVLTGDKQETAINIGYSCNLLSDDMWTEPFIVDGSTQEEVLKQLVSHRRSIEQYLTVGGKAGREELSMRTLSEASLPDSLIGEQAGLALVINGHSLVHALTPDMELAFLGVAEHCTSVICCRVTPLQKALVVELVKKYKEAVCLAIGDGANDVSMIKAADIGVGISGQEGMQAVLASDYSIAQFRYLERLLLVHGRWSYYRMCKFLRYFFYKNFAFTLCHFWYAFFCGFSAQNVMGAMFIANYNVFFTSLPVVILGGLEQDVLPATAARYPALYWPGIVKLWFSRNVFSVFAIHGLVTSLIIIGFCMGKQECSRTGA